ncbi:MAG TPA: hypothetical protein VG672_09065 [Bryobacteraceae bacterium]|nr:hypothetical protein [Bryobacteraceae bacterium]
MGEHTQDPEIDSNTQYRWRTPEPSKLVSAIQDATLQTLGPYDDFTGSIGKEGPPRERISYRSAEDWAASLTCEAESIQFQLWKDGLSLYGYFYPRRGEANVGFHGKVSQAESAKALVTKLARELNLEPRSEKRSNTVRLEGTYRLAAPEDPAWLIRVLPALAELAGGSSRFFGYFRLAATAQFQEETSDLPAWQKIVTENWKEVLEAGGSMDGEVGVIFRCDRLREEVRVTAEAGEREQARAALARFEETARLTPIRDAAGRTPVSGERRRYFAGSALSPEWLIQCLGIVESLNRGPVSFQGRFRIGEEEYSRSGIEEWKGAAIARWEEIRSLGCWYSSFGASQNLDIDLNREIVSVELQGRSEAAVADAFGHFEADLKLQRFEGTPYQYRKFARVYRIEEWKGGARAAEAVETAVKIAFPGKRRQITSAYITVGEKAEDLESYPELAPFLEGLRKPGEYTLANLAIEGPRGRLLGIRLDRGKSRLQLWSSIERREFQAVVGAFEERLDLALDKIEDAPKEKEAAKGGWGIWIPVVVSLVGAAASLAVALLTANNGLPSLKTTLEITAPAKNKDNVAEVSGAGTPVRWTISRKTLWSGERPEDCAATLIVERAGTEQPKEIFEHRSAGDFVTFPEAGRYYVTVKPEGRGDVQPGTILVNVAR